MDKKVEVIIGKNAGFCYGVKNAVEKTTELLEQKGKDEKIYCLGEIVHNKQVVENLEKRNLKVVEEIEELEDKERHNQEKIVIRAHGVPPIIYDKLKEKNYEIMDLTCPNVLAIHKIVEEFSDQGFYTFLIGKKNHPEVVGTFGFCKEASVIEKKEDINIAISNFRNSNKVDILVISQTTFSLAKFNEIVETIQEKIKGITTNKVVIRNTICNATRIRQEETNTIAKQVDYMVIIGGKNSSNTKKLYEIAQSNCKETICIETVKELPITEIKEKIKKIERKEFKIGIMAGASTPQESIEEVKRIFYTH